MTDRIRLLLVPMARDVGNEVGRLLAKLDRFEHIVAARAEAEVVARAAEETDADLLLLALAKDKPLRQGLELVARIVQKLPSHPLVVLAPERDDDAALGAVRRGAQDCIAVEALTRHEVVGAFQRIIERHRLMHGRRAGERRRAVGATATGVLDRLPLGVMLLDAGGQVLALNAKARQIIAAGDGLSVDVRSGSFRAEDAAQNEAMIRLVQRTILGQVGSDEACALAVSRPSMKPPLRLMVTSLTGRATQASSSTGVAIFISDPQDGVDAKQDVLRARYRLSAEETQVAQGLARGWQLDELAAACGVAEPVVRSRLQQVLRKTRAATQAELVKLLLTGPAGPRLTPGD